MPAVGECFVPLAFKIIGHVQQPGPITMNVDRLRANFPVKDTGVGPEENQQWILNWDVRVCKDIIRIVSATHKNEGYEISIQPGPGMGCIDLYIQETDPVSGECPQGSTRIYANPLVWLQIGREKGLYRAGQASQAEVELYWPRLVAIWPAYQSHYDAGVAGIFSPLNQNAVPKQAGTAGKHPYNLYYPAGFY